MSMTHEEAARILDPDTTREALNPYADSPVERMRLLDEACRIAADVLRNKPTGKPLTLEQLRNMCGHPIFIDDKKELENTGWVIWSDSFNRNWTEGKDGEEYGKTWLAYAYQPAHIDREAWKPCGEMCRNNCATCDHNADEVFGDADYCKDCHRYSKWESSIHKYCERCGRPRTPDAWAELEKRIGGFVRQQVGDIYTKSLSALCVDTQPATKLKSLFVAQFVQQKWTLNLMGEEVSWMNTLREKQ